MMADSELDGQVSLSLDQTEPNTSPIASETPRTRKSSVQLSETILKRLERRDQQVAVCHHR
jgi:hypothetical protein